SVTAVIFAGIENPRSRSPGSASFEDSTAVPPPAVQGECSSRPAEACTEAEHPCCHPVYRHCHQHCEFDNAGEGIHAGTITNSTGVDGQQTSTNIIVPTDAVLGSTGMRIIRSLLPITSDRCAAVISAGQIEDYTINVYEPCVPPVADAPE